MRFWQRKAGFPKVTRADPPAIDTISLANAGAGDWAVERGYFDRALLVTVPGEISNKHEAVAEIFRALRPGGILSITELMPDPHYLSWKAVRVWCDAAGFKEVASFGSWFAFTIDFIKPKISSQTCAVAA